MMVEISHKRRVINVVMLTLSGICTVLVVGVLFFILGYLLVHGARSLNWDFFTKLPKPAGETGGGMANAIVGSAKVLLGRNGDRGTDRLSGGSLPGGIQRQDVRVSGALHGGPPERCAVDCHWDRSLCDCGAADEALFRTGRRRGARDHDDSDCSQNDGRIPVGGSELDARRRNGAWSDQGENNIYGGGSGGDLRIDFGHDAQSGTSGGRNSSASIHRSGKHVLEQGLARTDCHAARDDLQLCAGPGRRSSPASLGGRLCFAHAHTSSERDS